MKVHGFELPEPTGPQWLNGLRQDAARDFERLGLPTTRREDWRYTSLRGLRGGAFPLAEPGAITPAQVDSLGLNTGVRLVMVDGRWSSALSTGWSEGAPAGLRIRSLEEGGEGRLGAAVPEDSPFVAANTVAFQDGLLIEVDRGALVEPVVEVLSLTTERPGPAACFPRIVVSTGAGSALTVVERHLGLGGQPLVVAAVTELLLGADSNLKHVLVQDQGASTHHFGTVAARPGRGAELDQNIVSLGGSVSRLAVHCVMAEEHARCRLAGVFAAIARQSLDHYTVIDHAVGNCRSSEIYKGIVASDDAIGSFIGRVLMRDGAVGSATDQLCRALLLSPGAKANVKPSLEIDNDDVTAAHGAAIGRLDPDQVFFLRSRGLTLELARALLIEAFAAEVLDALPVDGLGHDLTLEIARRAIPGVAVEALE